MNWSENDCCCLVISTRKFILMKFIYNFSSKGNVIDNLEEALELLDPTQLKACAKSVNGVNLSKMTSKQSLMGAILKHAKSSRSIQNYFSGRSLSVEQTILQ